MKKKKNYQKDKLHQKSHKMKLQKNYPRVKSQAAMIHHLRRNLPPNLSRALKKKNYRKNQL